MHSTYTRTNDTINSIATYVHPVDLNNELHVWLLKLENSSNFQLQSYSMAIASHAAIRTS